MGSSVTLNWTPPALVGTISGYVLELGSAPSGIYYVRVRAQSVCGLTDPSNEAAVIVP